MTTPIRVLIVDDSALVRAVLSELLGADPGIEVVGTAGDPLIARDRIRTLDPDVITLDVEMPKMDGITFLGHLMRLRPLPVVMISSLTEAGARITLEALALGAVDFIAKPKLDVQAGLTAYADELRDKVKAAARVRVKPRTPAVAQPAAPGTHPAPAPKVRAPATSTSGKAVHETMTALAHGIQVVAIGSSTGGTIALEELFTALPAEVPPIVATQHFPPGFSGPFAKRLDSLCRGVTVEEAQEGQVLLPGHVYIAPGARHLGIERVGGRLRCRIIDSPPVNRHCPSVDVLFRSVAHAAGQRALGVLLTGMGDDGARGLLELRQQSAPTIAQDERTSVVWGMPGVAVKLGAAAEVLPLDRIAGRIVGLTR